jgi:hypothetical protein
MAYNYGTVQNRGWELSLNYTFVRTKDWNVNVTFNMARNEDVMTELSPFADLDNFNMWNVNGLSNDKLTYITQKIKGQPVGAFYGYKYDGVYLNKEQTIAVGKDGNPIMTTDANGNAIPVYMTFGYPTINYQFQPGDARYVDINKDGQINYQDIVYLGNYTPLFHGGITPSIKWDKWSLNTVFYYRYGNDIVNTSRMKMENMYDFDNQAASVLRRWQHEYVDPSTAPNDLLPRALHNQGYNWLASDRFVEDGSYLRWKSFTLRYNFAKELVSKWKLQGLYIYFTMQNIYVLTNYTGQDPEVKLGSYSETSRAPVPKSYTLGLNLSF